MAEYESTEHKKALVIWRLRRDIEAMKDLCLRNQNESVTNEDVRKILVELHSFYEHLRRRLH